MGGVAAVRRLVVGGVIFAAGCATTPEGTRAGRHREDQSRAEAILAKLTDGMNARALRVRVSDGRTVGAYSWPDGNIELTGRLVARLEDDELAAALAHELGHLLGGQGVARSAGSALSGGRSADAVEARADSVATQLLARAGYPPDAMARTLTKVMRAPGITAPCRARLANRISLLAAPGTGPH